MQRFRADELRCFLAAVDRHLKEPFELFVIGGSAAALAYGASRATRDIDTWDPYYTRIDSALEAARKETGLNIPVEHPGVHDGPHDLEDRVQVVGIPGLRRLVVKVPEKHDLVLMKTLRGEEPDLQAAEDIKASQGLDFDTLLTRYVEEMSHCVGEPRRLDLNFFVLVERLYGERELEVAKRRVERMRGRRA
jgi:hypothetical protein